MSSASYSQNPSGKVAGNLAPVDEMRLTVLVEDKVNPEKPGLIAKHGLSFFIELKSSGQTWNLLLDTGPAADPLLQNVRKLRLDLRKASHVVLSHGHYDHTGGLLGFLNFVETKVPIILHPDALKPKFLVKKRGLKKIGFPFREMELEEAGGVLALRRDPFSPLPGVLVSGEIRREVPFEVVKGFRTMEGGRLVKDEMLDDQALFVSLRDKGLVVITGCAHAGVVNTIRQARRLTGAARIHAVVGGFHLFNASTRRIMATVKEFQKIGVEHLMPCHCSGRRAVARFVKVFGERCQRLRTGDSVIF
jgi:7,8-dihydropterin-6-yl-methyl-4-(beta-D-ribofuranosyl)aminobenzene 5'-phosphate synthase